MKENNKLIAFMSVKPEFAKKLMSGEKKYEYRKTSINNSTMYIIIYSTSPEKQILGIAKVKRIISGSPAATWEKTKRFGGISRTLFREYFKNKKLAYAIEIENVVGFDIKFSPTEINKVFNVPQSYRYVSEDFYRKTISKGLNGKEPKQLLNGLLTK